MTTVEAVPAPAVDGVRDDLGSHQFLVAVLVGQRAEQLRQGARPRIEADGHKINRLAHLEVMAGAVEWSVSPIVAPDSQSSDSSGSADGLGAAQPVHSTNEAQETPIRG